MHGEDTLNTDCSPSMSSCMRPPVHVHRKLHWDTPSPLATGSCSKQAWKRLWSKVESYGWDTRPTEKKEKKNIHKVWGVLNCVEKLWGKTTLWNMKVARTWGLMKMPWRERNKLDTKSKYRFWIAVQLLPWSKKCLAFYTVIGEDVNFWFWGICPNNWFRIPVLK